MAINKETRIFKSNTLEEFRQKSNEISLHLGDNDQLNANLADKTYNFVDVSAGEFLFQDTDDDSKEIRYELKPEEALDNTGGYIILNDVSSITGFNTNNTITQTGGFTATVVSSSTEKILIKNSSGTFDSTENISDGTNIIVAANIDRLIAESYSVGVVRVYKNDTELSQNLLADGFHTVTIAGRVTLSGNPNVTDITEGTVLNQGNGFTGTVLRCTSDLLIFKSTTNTGNFSAGANLRFDNNTTAIAASKHGDLITEDSGYGTGIELNTPVSANDDIKIFSMDAVAGLNELQDDIGVTENLTTTSNNLVDAINEHDAELGTITPTAMGTTASTVETAIREHEDQIGNVNINSIATGNNTITGALTQLHTEVGSLNLNTAASDLTSAVNELEADLFNSEGGNKRTVGDLLTSDNSSIVDSINELHTELFTSGVSFPGLTADNFKSAVDELRTELGDHTSLGTNTTTSAVAAINEIETALRGANTNYTVTAGSNIRDGLNAVYADIHTTGSVTLNTDASHLVGGINELETALRGTAGNYNLDTTANDVVAAINEHEADIGNMTLTGLSATDISAGLRELRTELGDVTAINSAFVNDSNVVVALNELQTEVGANAYPSGGPADVANATNLTNAINAIDAEIGDTSYSGADITTAVSTAQTNIGTIGSLNTSASNLVGAINEHELQINSNDTDIANLMTLIDGASTVDSSITFGGAIAATNIKSAIQELDTEKVSLTSNTQQNINSEIQFTGDINFVDGGTNADTFTFGTGTVLDVSNGSILLPGSAANVNIFSVAFLEVDGNLEAPMGFSVDRQHVTTITDTSDVRIQWHEDHAESKPARGWQLKGLNDSSQSNTADIVTFYNAKELITSNTESGINVSWDSTAQNFDFNVDDFTVTLGTGPISGSFDITNLGDATFNTTLDANSVTLGTHTTGAYVRRILGTANEIEVSSNNVENASVTIGLPNSVDIIDLDVTGTTNSTSSTTGALTVAGGLGVAQDVFIGGDLVVQGDTVTLNTETLTVEDTLVLAGNNLISEPSSGGFGLEVGPITSPSGVASGVTGAHSIVYNYATDRWEADGSLILSEATLGSPTIESIDYTSSRNLDFINGTGITVATALNGSDIDVTVTNTDRGSSQNIFKKVAVSGQNTIVADNNNDTLTVAGLDVITVTTNSTTDTISIDHNNVGAGAATYGQTSTEDGSYIKSIQVSAQGHVLAVTDDDFDNRYVNEGQANSIDSNMYVDGSIDRVHLSADIIDSTKLANNAVNSEHYVDGSIDRVHLSADIIDSTKIANDSINSEHYVDGSIDTAHIANNQVTLAKLAHSTENHVLQYSATGVPETGLVATANIADLNVTREKIANDAINGSKIANDAINSEHYVDGSIDTAHIGNDQVTYAKIQNIATANRLLGSTIADGIVTEVQVQNAMIATDAVNGNKIADNSIDSEHYVDGSIDNVHLANDSVNGSKIANDSINSEHYVDGSIDTAHIGSNQVTLDKIAHSTANHVLQYSSNGTPETGFVATENISNDAVTYAKIQNVSATNRILGRDSAGAGNIEEISPSALRSMINVADGATNTSEPNNKTITLTGDNIFIGSDSSSTTTTSEAFTTNQSSNETIYIRNAAPNVTTNLSTTQSGNTVRINSSDGTNATIAVATTSNAGVISTTDKSKLDNIASGANNYSLPLASSSTRGGVKIGYAENGRNYPVELSSEKMYVNVPWTDNNTQYSAGTGLDLVGTQFRIESDLSTDIDKVGRSGVHLIFDTSGDDPDLIFQLDGTVEAKLYHNGNFHADGDVVAFSSAISSDEKLKDNIQVVDGALEKVVQLDGVTFDWKRDGTQSAGVIAQNVEKVLPRAVKEVEDLNGDDTFKTVDYNQLSALFIEAIKELKEENNLLRAEIEALKDINS